MALLKGSDGTYVLGLQPLGTLLHLELHLRAFIQRTVAVRLNSRKMHEHVIAGGALDKSKSLRGVKPLNYTFFFHLLSPDSLFAKHFVALKNKKLRRCLRSSSRTRGDNEQPLPKTTKIRPYGCQPVKRMYTPKPYRESGFRTSGLAVKAGNRGRLRHLSPARRNRGSALHNRHASRRRPFSPRHTFGRRCRPQSSGAWIERHRGDGRDAAFLPAIPGGSALGRSALGR